MCSWKTPAPKFRKNKKNARLRKQPQDVRIQVKALNSSVTVSDFVISFHVMRSQRTLLRRKPCCSHCFRNRCFWHRRYFRTPQERERAVQKAEKTWIPSFKLLLLLFEKHRETCGNFSENGEIYTYNIIYIMPIVWSAFFWKNRRKKPCGRILHRACV